MLYDAYQRGDLTLGQGVIRAPSGGADQVFQAIAAAIYFATGNLDRPQVLHDAHHGVEVVARGRLHPAYVLPFLEVLSPVTKDRHAQIVHRFDLDHIGHRVALPAAIPGTIWSCKACSMIVWAGERCAGGESEADINAKRVLDGLR